ncbi:unnamed protein product, partial [Closterium sp. NIES-53]
ASRGQRRSLPLPDNPTPQQLREWVLQRARPGGGGFSFLRTAQRGQQSQQETFSPQVLSELFPQRCVTGSVEAAALGASESAAALGASDSAAALGASESAAALGARASPATGPSSAEALHTFTLDSGASRCFFRDCTTLTPLAAPVPVSLADPTGGPVVARASTVLSCPAVPSGSLSSLHLPTFSTSLVSSAAIQDVWVDTFIRGGQRVAICMCSRTGRHLATFTRRLGSSLYTLTTASAQVAEAGQVATSSHVYASGQLAASCSCRVLSHQTLLWHHRLGHPSLPRLRGMHSHLLVSGLPRSLPSLLRSPALPCLPCVAGRQRAAPHSSEFPPTTAPLQTLHMDVWGPAPDGGTDQERYFLLVVDDYTPVRAVHSFLRLHYDRGDEFSSDLLAEFCRDECIVQIGIAEHRIGLIMEVAHTSMIHADAPHFLCPFAVRYAAHELNVCPEGDPDALDIPTPCSYAEAIADEYSSQWQTAMDAEMASWNESAAPGAGEAALLGTASAQILHTFTLDSGASRSFFRDCTTLSPLSRLVAVSLAETSGGPVLAHSSTILPCPVVPSGSLSGLYLPSFSTNLVSGADLQDQGVDQFTPASQRVTHCPCTRTGRHLATFTRQPGSSLYTLTTVPPPVAQSGQVATSGQVFAAASRSGPESAPCSCRLLSHQTLLWHHRLGHPSLPRLRGMAFHVLVTGLPRSLPPLPPGPAPTCVPCVEGRQRAAPQSSDFPPTESFGSDLPVLHLHSDRGGEFSSDLLRAFCRAEGIRQTFTLPASPQQNGIAERRIGMVMDVARTSMIHAAAPHFLWPFAVQYAAHQINLQPRVSVPETTPTLRWTGKVGDASAFCVWGSRAFVRDLSADKLSSRAVPCVFLGFPP